MLAETFDELAVDRFKVVVDVGGAGIKGPVLVVIVPDWEGVTSIIDTEADWMVDVSLSVSDWSTPVVGARVVPGIGVLKKDSKLVLMALKKFR